MVGGLLVAIAAVVVFAAVLAGSGAHQQQYAVSTRALAAGSVISAGEVGTASMKLPSATAAVAYRQTPSLIGRTVAVAVSPGELIQSSMLVPAGVQPPVRPVSISVDPSSLDSLSQGQSVDVLDTVTPAAGSGSGASKVTIVVRGATLMSVDRSDSNLLSGSGSGDTLVTLGVANLSEVEAVIGAAADGTATLVAAEPSDGVGAGPGPGSAPGSASSSASSAGSAGSASGGSTGP